MAFMHYGFFHNDKNRIARGLGGFVCGLVAIAACAQTVTFVEAATVGAGAGLLHNISFNFLRKSFLKHAWQVRAVYLVAIHAIGGIWGTLCAALLGSDGSFEMPEIDILAVQVQGIVVALVYSTVMANGIVWLLSRKKSPQPT